MGDPFAAALASPLFAELRRRVEASGEACEGSVMHTWNSWADVPEMEAKQRNLFQLAREAHGGQILEVGFNAGHSVCLMMLAQGVGRVTAFDLAEHRYTKPCVEALRDHFGRERLELVEGPSSSTLPQRLRERPEQRYDLFHVDGGHQYHQALSDLRNCRSMAHDWTSSTSVIVMDDIDLVGVHAAWDDFLAEGGAVPREAPYALGRYKHGIGQVVPYPEQASRCSACGAVAVYGCGGCGKVRYCCVPCARAHWRLHRRVCLVPKALEPEPLEKVSISELLTRREGLWVASRDLFANDVLFVEPALAWQPAPTWRHRLCAACGAAPERLCPACGQVMFCSACPVSCKMCPELAITRGHVGAFTLLALEVLRDWEERRLPSDALAVSEVREEARRAAVAVQKVGHFCSAVRWSDRRAEDVVAAVLQGKVEQSAMVGYYPKLSRLRARNASREANVVVQTQGTAIQVLVTSPVRMGEAIRV